MLYSILFFLLCSAITACSPLVCPHATIDSMTQLQFDVTVIFGSNSTCGGDGFLVLEEFINNELTLKIGSTPLLPSVMVQADLCVQAGNARQMKRHRDLATSYKWFGGGGCRACLGTSSRRLLNNNSTNVLIEIEKEQVEDLISDGLSAGIAKTFVTNPNSCLFEDHAVTVIFTIIEQTEDPLRCENL